MKVGLWNLDHPEAHSGNRRKEQRFVQVLEQLQHPSYEVWILTESNAAIELDGFQSEFSEKSPYLKQSRYYGEPNLYQQVSFYSRYPLSRMDVEEPINGLLCSIKVDAVEYMIYGNVITLKDRRSDTPMKYSDRLKEQIRVISELPLNHILIGGDFNLKKSWPAGAHKKVRQAMKPLGWCWPTEEQNDTVQQVLHSPDLKSEVSIDTSVRHDKGKHNRLSDHPLVTIEVTIC